MTIVKGNIVSNVTDPFYATLTRGPKEVEFFRGKLRGSFIEGWPCGLQKLEDWVFRSPPEWNEYIPKKNRHSENVPKVSNVNQHEPTHTTQLGGGEHF